MTDLPLSDLVAALVTLFFLLACCELGVRYLRRAAGSADGSSSGGGGDS